jgi:hypothetical protein
MWRVLIGGVVPGRTPHWLDDAVEKLPERAGPVGYEYGLGLGLGLGCKR